VSLEAAKWSQTLERLGHQCFYFAGECDRPAASSCVVPEAHFDHPDISVLNADLFDDVVRTPETSERVRVMKDDLKQHLYRFLAAFQPQLLIVENALSLPMNVPLGLALTEVIAETSIPTIAHHHDFFWERERFAINAAFDYLHAAFPPTLNSIHHVVINSVAARQVAWRTGMPSTVVPNVMDFAHPPPPPDDQARSFRAAVGVRPGEALLLQPTRIVPRKRIERAVEVVRRLDLPAALVISHAAVDEGAAYEEYLREFTALIGARVIFAGDLVAHLRGQGGRPFGLADAYQSSDLVTYPSAVEGFGNAFLEAVYYRRPILMSSYEIFSADIQPKGFRVITFGEFVDKTVLKQVRDWLGNAALVAEAVELNYSIAQRFYSYQVLEKHLALLINASLGA